MSGRLSNALAVATILLAFAVLATGQTGGGGITPGARGVPFVRVSNGTSSLPSISFQAEPALGLYRRGAGSMTMAATGVGAFVDFTDSAGNKWVSLRSDLKLGFSSGDPSAAIPDAFITRVGVGELNYTTVAFAALGTPANGSMVPCTDCAPTTPASCPGTKASCVCTSGGVGSLAVRVNATWYCPF